MAEFGLRNLLCLPKVQNIELPKKKLTSPITLLFANTCTFVSSRGLDETESAVLRLGMSISGPTVPITP